jgi:hypothetical protein
MRLWRSSTAGLQKIEKRLDNLEDAGKFRRHLSGDTGIHTEMKTVVNEYHKANLALMNLGPSAGTTLSAAYAINELVQPASVIATHPNEAVTEGGKLKAESRTAAFIGRLKSGRSAHLAVSGRTMEFDGTGKCVSGC